MYQKYIPEQVFFNFFYFTEQTPHVIRFYYLFVDSSPIVFSLYPHAVSVICLTAAAPAHYYHYYYYHLHHHHQNHHHHYHLNSIHKWIRWFMD